MLNAIPKPPTHTYTPPSHHKDSACIPKSHDKIIHNAQFKEEKDASFLQSSHEVSYMFEPTGGLKEIFITPISMSMRETNGERNLVTKKTVLCTLAQFILAR